MEKLTKTQIKDRLRYLEEEQKKEYSEYREKNIKKLGEKLKKD